ncbi:metalloregulator ArsR/SmtB family transcription factor [Pseudarthrobacter sp. NamE5]|uniref:metalloregulator ArsR/SmtB family transcription factor n=1 Tax=Pseudarthrobacter sp. NamE5 TaxID=2576839 RepID=UPI00110B6327|nr:metalloregulator ArsR/SmtB family transcription factor [Pseudarthrobacter sp. NamE5]TLM88214.1 metalloregulator ArsR/SmtB family transcription factor [Pseudarthrobacter sp. NamE5]
MVVGQANAVNARAVAEAELFKALAHPARARVLGVLANGLASVPELCTATGMKPSHLAGHLTQLRAQHLVTGTRSGGRLLYGLSFPEIARVLAAADVVLSARAAAQLNGLDTIGASEPSAQDPVNENLASVVEEFVPVLEESLQTRALIAKAVESVSSRTGLSSDAARNALLAESVERRVPLAEVARDAVASGETDWP